jgi:organic radical activating enzyme
MQFNGSCCYNVSKNILETLSPNVVNVVFRRTEKCGVRCGYCSRPGHTNDICYKKEKYVKTSSIANNYLEIPVHNETTILEK